MTETMREKIARQKAEARQQGIAQEGGGDWFKMNDGENRFRVLTEFEVIFKDYKEGICYTDCGWQGTPKYMCYVAVREKDIDGNERWEIKLAELPSTVGDAIVNLQVDEDYGFDSLPMPYDVKVNREKTGTEAKDVKYHILPGKETELPAEVIEELDKKTAIPEVVKRLKEKNMEKHGVTPSSKAAEVESLEQAAQSAPDYPESEYDGEPTI